MSATAAVEEVREAVREAPRALPVGGASKPALSRAAGEGTVAIDTAALRGITAYDPSELTFTALAGTPLAEIEEELARHGQGLPFDPPLRAAGATLGGAIATGVPGSAALGAGIVRDFVIGITVVDGRGRLVSGGGRVVKNAAGFDLPKLMVGSAGRLGVIVEASCKVFPQPAASATVAFDAASPEAALKLIAALGRGPQALVAVDLEPPGRVLVRLAGAADLLDERVARLCDLAALPGQRLDAAAEAAHRQEVAECGWVPAGSAIVVAPLVAARLLDLDARLADAGAARRYSLAGGLAWIAWPGDRNVDDLSDLLAGCGLAGLALTGPPAPSALIGAAPGNPFADRVRAALDPDGRFLELWP